LRELAAIAPANASPAGLLDALMSGMGVEAGREDDVALLAVRRVPALSSLSLDLAPSADLTAVRGEVRDWLRDAGVTADVIDEVLLALSEALINAIEHSGAGDGDLVAFRAQAYDHRLRMVVRDHGRWRPQGPARARGHGLRIMRALMDVSLRVDGDGTRLELTREIVRR
jgi:anti-sigma regulatory factor (Ser/Thr protein kinase)